MSLSLNVQAPKDAELRRLLDAKGVRVTEQRLVILRELMSLSLPVSHSELTKRLAGTTLDRVTIYRNLLALSEAGILVRTQLGDNQWRFELTGTGSVEHDRHPHLVCSECGTVSCLPASAVTLRGEAALAEGVTIQLRGRCLACGRNRGSAKPARSETGASSGAPRCAE
jgi:Fur family transcriptional regulator, ferric uptake regulator